MSRTMANSRETIATTQNEAASESCRSGKQTQETKSPSAKSQGAKPISAKSPSAKCLELPETRHTVGAVEEAVDNVVVDTEAPGGKPPNNNRISVVTCLLLASGVGPWIIHKEPLPLTGMVHQNSGRCR